MPNDIAVIKVFSNEMEAAMAQQVLVDEGIWSSPPLTQNVPLS